MPTERPRRRRPRLGREDIKKRSRAWGAEDLTTFYLPQSKDNTMAGKTQENSAKEAPVKARCWVFVAYPESMPENWLEILRETHVAMAISPLHDKDVTLDENGKEVPKKAHYHIMMFWDGPVTNKGATEIARKLGSNLVPQKVERVKGQYRYLWHADDPDKYQYDQKDMLQINGFNVIDHVGNMTTSEEDSICERIEAVITSRELEAPNLLALRNYLSRNGMLDELRYLRRNTIWFSSLLRAKREYKNDLGKQRHDDLMEKLAKQGKTVDPETGEIIEADKEEESDEAEGNL